MQSFNSGHRKGGYLFCDKKKHDFPRVLIMFNENN
jgi:hypothetical protein